VAKNNTKEREYRLRPPKPPARSERVVLTSAFKIIMHHARMSGRRVKCSFGLGQGIKRARRYFQRCAVRVTYTKNATTGQWRAHGRYVARESASQKGDSKGVGFNKGEQSVDIAERLEKWQKTGDELLWKLILSPEFGDRVDLKGLSQDTLSRMERDLGSSLEWVAVAHYNTEHPHIHVALRGVGADGRPLRLSPDYIKHGVRAIAEELCTRQLGHRTEIDAAEAQRREISQHRYTSLDRIIQRDADNGEKSDSPFFTITKGPHVNGRAWRDSLAERSAAERLMVLGSMGLAESIGPNVWRVRRDFEKILRAMQRSADRQKTLAAHGALISDQRLQLVTFDLRSLETLEGRILVHGEEETSGRRYLMLEGTDARVHYINYTPEMEEARNRGGLRTNSFIRLRKLFTDGHPALDIDELGDSEAMLRNKRYLRETHQRLSRRGIVPQEDGWNGWLGRYQQAIAQAATLIEHEPRAQKRERDRSRDHGR
jgi:type IV secretory pathway VirD2 relaxase